MPYIEGTQIVIAKKKKKLHPTTIYNFTVKDYNKNLVNKLPNEFKGALKDYNPLSISYLDMKIDENKYDCF